MPYVLIVLLLLFPPLLVFVALRVLFGPVSRWPDHG